MGAYVAFVDIGLGITEIFIGTLVDQFGYSIIFLLDAAAFAAALAIGAVPLRLTAR